MIARRALSSVRLSTRFARFELAFAGGLTVLLAAATVLVVRELASLAPPAVCLEPYDIAPPLGCDAASQAFYELRNRVEGPLMSMLTGVPIIAGVLIGVTLVAREVERGTARLSWSLSPSRVRWFVTRLVPTLGMFVGFALVAGVAADLLTGAVRPGADMGSSFEAFGNRGVVLAGRSVLVMAIAVAVGAVMGRVLPAAIVTAVIAAVAIAGGSVVHQSILRSEAIVLKDFDWQSDLYADQRFRLPDGSLVGWEFFEGRPESQDQDGNPIYPMITIGVPGERYGFAQVREVGALLGASTAFLLVGLFVTDRRRPD